MILMVLVLVFVQSWEGEHALRCSHSGLGSMKRGAWIDANVFMLLELIWLWRRCACDDSRLTRLKSFVKCRHVDVFGSAIFEHV